MVRKARIDAPGAIQHIIIRGIESKAIFQDTQDYKNFLERMSVIVNETATPCYAWAFMSNHVHLLFRTGNIPLSTIMRRLLTGYAQQFNRRHKRHGQLFQNRFKSFLCEEEPYLLELVRYIHLNPIRARMVKDLKGLNTYPKTGHSVLMGKIKNDWQDTDYVLKRFGKTLRDARKAYLTFVSKGLSKGRRADLVGGGLLRSIGGWSVLKALRATGMRVMGDERILGSSDFVEAALKQANEFYEKKTLALAKGIDLDTLIKSVAEYFKLDADLLKSSSRQRKVAQVRAIICGLAVDHLMISGAEVARLLNLSPSAVSKLASRGRGDAVLRKIAQDIFNFGSLGRKSVK
ncbi:MAG: transposase [Desulfobacterales bacterium]|nr:MAG: transposase [Desulfobacterales bacterium]